MAITFLDVWNKVNERDLAFFKNNLKELITVFNTERIVAYDGLHNYKICNPGEGDVINDGTVLMLCILLKFNEVIEMFLNYDENQYFYGDLRGSTIMHHACYGNQEAAIIIFNLYKKKFPLPKPLSEIYAKDSTCNTRQIIRRVNDTGLTPIFYALQEKYYKIALDLLPYEYDIFNGDNDSVPLIAFTFAFQFLLSLSSPIIIKRDENGVLLNKSEVDNKLSKYIQKNLVSHDVEEINCIESDSSWYPDEEEEEESEDDYHYAIEEEEEEREIKPINQIIVPYKNPKILRNRLKNKKLISIIKNNDYEEYEKKCKGKDKIDKLAEFAFNNEINKRIAVKDPQNKLHLEKIFISNNISKKVDEETVEGLKSLIKFYIKKKVFYMFSLENDDGFDPILRLFIFYSFLEDCILSVMDGLAIITDIAEKDSIFNTIKNLEDYDSFRNSKNTLKSLLNIQEILKELILIITSGVTIKINNIVSRSWQGLIYGFPFCLKIYKDEECGKLIDYFGIYTTTHLSLFISSLVKNSSTDVYDTSLIKKNYKMLKMLETVPNEVKLTTFENLEPGLKTIQPITKSIMFYAPPLYEEFYNIFLAKDMEKEEKIFIIRCSWLF